MQNIILLFHVVISLAIILSLAIKKWEILGSVPIAVSSIAVVIWSIGQLVQGNSTFFDAPELISVLMFTCLIIALSMQVMVGMLIGYARYLDQRLLLLALLIIPALIIIAYGQHPFLEVFLKPEFTPTISHAPFAKWGSSMILFARGLAAWGLISMIIHLLQIKTKAESYHWLLMITFFVIFVMLALRGSGNDSHDAFINAMLPVMSVSNVVLAFCINKHALSSSRIDRTSVVEAMLDGWMMLDENNKIVDLNRTAEEILGSKKTDAIGKPIAAFQIDIPSSSNFAHSPRDMEMKKSFRTRDDIKYFNIRLSPIQNEDGRLFTLITWRDITNRRKVEDLRQKARDEMFVLLNAISSEASQSFSMEEFLSGVIYQIIFPFRSQAAIIYLGDNNDTGIANQAYYPASVFGISDDIIKPISLSSESYKLLNQVFMDGDPFFVDNPIGETRLPPALQTDNYKSILVLPLIIRNGSDAQNMGILVLARKDPPPYSHDEIARLGTLADHIANLVDNERRRKLAIAFSERQRLMRDLHDSVSQKLYGLVTLTEAAQAAMEAGQNTDPEDVLIRIGDNARQAVKEMRLFLYQMQPVEIEKDGLISVLHHRLSAVEGRADIKAGLIADETIKLPPEKEIALFYIAQEALNNILRHARAKKISVTFKQARKNIILRIEDNGIGFDVKNVDRTGLGLANMKDRSEKIDGKLKIESTPGLGTTVVVTLPKPSIK